MVRCFPAFDVHDREWEGFGPFPDVDEAPAPIPPGLEAEYARALSEGTVKYNHNSHELWFGYPLTSAPAKGPKYARLVKK